MQCSVPKAPYGLMPVYLHPILNRSTG